MRACIAALALCASCAPDASSGDGDARVSFGVPRALLECAAPPDGLAARMWISGSEVPCPLDVDVDGNTTSGACEARPGLVRTLTVDWFVAADGIGQGVDLVLAQARGSVDLTKGDVAAVTFEIGDDDVVTTGCRDMRDDQVDGSEIVEIDGVGVPVCDVDDSCAGEDGACTNLGELCAGTDPFDAGDEP